MLLLLLLLMSSVVVVVLVQRLVVVEVQVMVLVMLLAPCEFATDYVANLQGAHGSAAACSAAARGERTSFNVERALRAVQDYVRVKQTRLIEGTYTGGRARSAGKESSA